jgi:pre-mRNA cleavage complex 2 protein Pcf11
VCRICMDEFKKDYIDEQWVWLDAIKVGDRYYHASCYTEATKDAASSRVNRATPEPVLGKRKAEVGLAR